MNFKCRRPNTKVSQKPFSNFGSITSKHWEVYYFLQSAWSFPSTGP